MRNLIRFLGALIFLCLLNGYLYPQSTNLGNTQFLAGDYVGWDNVGIPNQPLNILTQQVQPINFFTGTGAVGPPWPNQRMQIYDAAAAGALAGNVGLSDPLAWGAGFVPQSLLHLDNSVFVTFPITGNPVYAQWTNAVTGNTLADGFQAGLDFFGAAELRQQEDGPLDFYSNDASNTIKRRMRITHGNGGPQTPAIPEVTKVCINYASPLLSYCDMYPIAQLNLGDIPLTVSTRTWMDVGTYGSLNSDHFYLGLKEELTSLDEHDAVFAWGDNTSNPTMRDYMRFIFVTDPAKPVVEQGSFDGLEIMRLTPHSNVGIGNFAYTNGSGIMPHRRLEIYDKNMYQTDPVDEPQLRLTYTPDLNVGDGIWTDFQTTLAGDLFIHPSSDAGGSPVDRRVGVNIFAPMNTVEIHSGVPPATLSYPSLNAESRSGLKFSNLDETMAPDVNANIKGTVLSVNDKGDVILVDGGASALQPCSTATALTYDAAINHDVQNFYFEGVQGNVGIGMSCNPLLAKLHVNANDDNTNVAGRFQSIINIGAINNTPNIGVLGIAEIGKVNIGGDFYGSNQNNSLNIGVSGTASGLTYTANPPGFCPPPAILQAQIGHIGGKFSSCGSVIANYGVHGTVNPVLGAANVAVYGGAPGIPGAGPAAIAVYGDLGIGLPAPICNPLPCGPFTFASMAGYFNGDVVSTQGIYTVSDENLKENIQDIPNALEVLNELSPKWYSFNHSQNSSMNLALGDHYGLMAQDVQQVLPNIVKDCIHPARYDEEGNETYAAIDFKAINYTELIPLLVAGMKQQQEQIEALQSQISNQSEENNQSQDNRAPSNTIDVTLSSKSIVLNQNQPNPFKEQTTITYFIPDDTKNVMIMFTDAKGNVMKEVAIAEKGKGQLNVYAQDLSTGIYTYTLIADGVTIDSKKMVCNK
jgi:hypothetical protein